MRTAFPDGYDSFGLVETREERNTRETRVLTPSLADALFALREVEGVIGLDDDFTTNPNSLKARIHVLEETGVGGGVTDHAALTGLTVGDDHTQYALLAGRAGGQILRGGTASGNALSLYSTSHATKGKLIFGATGNHVFDEQLGRWGLGVPSPAYTFDLSGTYRATIGSTVYRIEDNQTDSTNQFTRIGGRHYLVAEEPMAFVVLSASNGANQINYGGGTALMNLATAHFWHVGADSITTGSNELMRFVNPGYLSIGGTSGSARIRLQGTITADHTLRNDVTINASSTGSHYGFLNDSQHNPAGASLTNVIGASSTPTLTGSSITVSNMMAYHARVDLDAGFSGTVTTASGFRMDNPAVAGGSITTLYGVLVQDLTAGTNNRGLGSAVSSGANKWNLYASGTASNYGAGDWYLGTTTQQNNAHINSSYTNSGTSGTDVSWYMINTHSPGSASTAGHIGAYFDTRATGASDMTGSVTSIFGVVRITGSATNYGTFIGVSGIGTYGSTATNFGTIVGSEGVRATAVNTFTNNPTGTITNSYAIRVLDSARGGAALTLTSLVGVLIAQQTLGTNNANLVVGGATIPSGTWNIFSPSTRNSYLNGNILLGDTTAPASATLALAMVNGTAPSGNMNNGVILYSLDRAAGEAGLGIRNESGKLHIISDRVGWFTQTPDEAMTLETGNFKVKDGYIVDDDVVRPFITVGGDDLTRTFTVNIRKFDQASSGNTRFYLHWWISTTSYGTSGTRPGWTYSVTTGTNEDAVSSTTSNFGWTDGSGNFVVQISTSNPEPTTTAYFHVEVQGIIYQASGTVRDGTA